MNHRKVAILFDNFGPYHLARLKAASAVCELLAVEFGSSSTEYAWRASESEGFKRVTLNEHGAGHDLSNEEFQSRLFHVLDEYQPDAVVVPGWGYRGALIALYWGLLHFVPVICMSESTQWDEARNPVKEWIKRRIIGLFSSALVGGTPHRNYIMALGMPADRIFLGYDVVDNRFFAEKSEEQKARSLEPRQQRSRYFLASARFIEKKNLLRLIRAYARYWDKASTSFTNKPWDLVLLGDGEMRPKLEKLRSELGLQNWMEMPGFKQYEELPAYYAAAGAFIHASTTEQWGLVVNEAMASGLPVLVSNRCGCAVDLVKDGENGWTFDPTNQEQIADLMLRISSDEDARARMELRSREIISEWGPDCFASGLTEALQASSIAPRKKVGLLDRLILRVMTRK